MITEGIVNADVSLGIRSEALTREGSEAGGDFLAVLMTALVQSGESQQILPLVNQNLPNELLSEEDILLTEGQISSDNSYVLGVSDLVIPGIGNYSFISGENGSEGKAENLIDELLQAEVPVTDNKEFVSGMISLSGARVAEPFLAGLYTQSTSSKDIIPCDIEQKVINDLPQGLLTGEAKLANSKDKVANPGQNQVPLQTIVSTVSEAPQLGLRSEDISMPVILFKQGMSVSAEDNIANPGQNQSSAHPAVKASDLSNFGVGSEDILTRTIKPVGVELVQVQSSEPGKEQGVPASGQKDDKSAIIESNKSIFMAKAEVTGGIEKTFPPAVSGNSLEIKGNPQTKNPEGMSDGNNQQDIVVRAESIDPGFEGQTESGAAEKGLNAGNIGKVGQQEAVIQATTSFSNLTPKKFPTVVVPQILSAVQEMGNDREKVTVIRLNLEPQSLGEIRIKLSYVNGELSAHFHTASGMVKDAIESSLSQLKDNLAQFNVNLGNATASWGQQQQGQKWQSFKGNQDNKGFLSESSAGMFNQMSGLGESYGQGTRESVDMLI
ncbi:MAG: flagellar hook-length control protein FliK [Peptococcaceae bacterium]|nr:flagellar hook-length control protein FliK [Peptococcaceae bacterium]